MRRKRRVVCGLVPERHIERTREPLDPDAGEWGEDPESVRESDADPDPWPGDVESLDADDGGGEDGTPEDHVVVSVSGKADALAQLLRGLLGA